MEVVLSRRLLLSLLWFLALPAFAADYPVRLTLYDFFGQWNFARMTELDYRPGPDGGTLETQRTGFFGRYEQTGPYSGSKQPNLLAEFQRRALLWMLQDGYISREMFDSAESGVGIWAPNQIRYAVAWSEVTYDEALRIFNGNIPWDRVMGGDWEKKQAAEPEWVSAEQVWNWQSTWPRERKIRFVRAGLLFAVGQQLHPLTGEILPLRLSWQKHAPFAPVAEIDRTQSPLVAEVSRVMGESGALGLDPSVPARALLGVLAAEARNLNIPPSQYRVYGWTLAPDRAAYFRFLLGMKDVINPTPREALLSATLEELLSRTHPERLSQRMKNLVALSQNRMTLTQAAVLREGFTREVYKHFIVPNSPLAAPICVMDGTLFPHAFAADRLDQWGLSKLSDRILQGLTDTYTEVNAYTDIWAERGYVGFQGELDNTIIVDNLNEQAAEAYPVTFVTRALLSVFEHYRNRAQHLPPNVRSWMINLERRYRTPKLTEKFTAEEFIRTTSFLVKTTSRIVHNQLVALGAKAEPAIFVGEPVVNQSPTGVRVEMTGVGYASALRFNGTQMLQLAELTKSFNLETQPVCAAHLAVRALITSAAHY